MSKGASIKKKLVLSLVVVLSAGCANGTDAPEATEAPAAGLPVAAQIVPEPVDEGHSEEAADLARFVASAEAALSGTPGEGSVMEQPEIHIALGQVACAQFSAGDSFAQVVDGIGLGDAQVTGAVIGAAVETICTEHRDQI